MVHVSFLSYPYHGKIVRHHTKPWVWMLYRIIYLMMLFKLLTRILVLDFLQSSKWLLFIEPDSSIMRSVAMVLKPQISTYDMPSLVGMSEWWLKSTAMKLRKLWMKGVDANGILSERREVQLLVEMTDKADLFWKRVVTCVAVFFLSASTLFFFFLASRSP